MRNSWVFKRFSWVWGDWLGGWYTMGLPETAGLGVCHAHFCAAGWCWWWPEPILMGGSCGAFGCKSKHMVRQHLGVARALEGPRVVLRRVARQLMAGACERSGAAACTPGTHLLIGCGICMLGLRLLRSFSVLRQKVSLSMAGALAGACNGPRARRCKRGSRVATTSP